MERIRRIIRGGLKRVASVVSRNELFEKPADRARTAPLPPRGDGASTAQVKMPAVEAVSQPAAAPVVSEVSTSTSQEMLSVPVMGLDALQGWLGSGRGLRVVNHWATWCIPCVEEFDLLKSLHAQLPDGVPLEGLSWDLFDPRGDEDDIAEHVANFSAGHRLSWSSVLIGEAVDAAAFFEMFSVANETIPQTWLVDDLGAVLYRVEGVLTEAHIEPLLSAIYSSGGDFGDEENG
jgi:thiol-disulfide isomerase/thioredoxin